MALKMCFFLLTLTILNVLELEAAQTELFLVNLSKNDIINTVATVDAESDWDFGSGPQHNFQAVQIPSGGSVRAIEYVNDYAPYCPFTLLLEFADGSKDQFRINQKFAIGQCWPDFQQLLGSKQIFYEEVDSDVLMITIKDSATV